MKLDSNCNPLGHCRQPAEHYQTEAVESAQCAGGEVRLGSRGGQEVLRLSAANARVQPCYKGICGGVPAASLAGAGRVRLAHSAIINVDREWDTYLIVLINRRLLYARQLS